MITEVFKTVILLSVSGSAVILLLMLLKPFTERRFGAVWQYYIWLVAIIALLFPFRLDMPVSVPHETAVKIYEVSELIDSTQVGDVPIVPAETANSFTMSLTDVLAILWLITASVLIIYKTVCYIIFKHSVRKSSVYERKIGRISIYRNSAFTSPLLIGIFRPVLIIPESLVNQNELDHVLMHELMHHKRFDIVYKWLAVFVKCLHWFNPFAYILAWEVDSECEISCDALLTRKMNTEEKKAYMNTVLTLIERRTRKSFIPFASLANNKRIITKRFKMIKRASVSAPCIRLISATAALILCISGIFICSFVTAVPGFAQELIPKAPIPVKTPNRVTQDKTEPERKALEVSDTDNSTSEQIFSAQTPAITESALQIAISEPEYPAPNMQVVETTMPDTALPAESVTSGTEHSSANVEQNESINRESSAPTEQPSETKSDTESEPTKPATAPIKKTAPSDEKYATMEIVEFSEKKDSDTMIGLIEESGDNYIKGEFRFEDGTDKVITGVKPDKNGNITLHLDSDSNEVIQVEVSEAESKNGVWGVRVPAEGDRAYSFTGLDTEKEYNISLYSPAKESWKIDSEYIIY